MKAAISILIGLVLSVSVGAEPLIEGRVRLESGAPVAAAQVRLFDMTDLQRGAIARATTDGAGYFALPLAALRGSALPISFALGPNYPNPFNPSTIIPYQLAASSEVRLEVFNLLGQRLATLVDGERPAGFHTATWHATDAAGRAVGAGVYIYRMTVGVESQTGRMVLVDGQAGVAAAGAASDWPSASGVGRPAEEVYGLIVSGEGLVPYVDSSFRVAAGMAPVELVVEAGPHSAGKAPDDDCALCDLFDAFDDAEEEDAKNTPEDEAVGPSGKAQATLEAPPAPLNLRVEAITDTSARVRWDAVEGATDYDVNYKKAQGGEWTNVPHRGTTLYNTLTGLEPGTQYRWAVRAENKDGTSDWVFGENFRTLGAPDPPTNLRITDLTETSVRLHWDAVAGATDYDVNYKKAQGGRWTNVPHRGTALYNTLTGLELGTQYRWAVRAENDMGASAWVYADNFTTLGKGPDLLVQSPSVSAVRLTPGQAFTLQATVHNQGDEQAAATVLHYYRSNNATITASDTEVGTDAVGALAASATSAQSIALTAPTGVSAGVAIFYGACVASVRGESNTDNNCSTAVKITVSGQETPEEDDKAEEEEEAPGEEEETPKEMPDDALVTIPDTNLRAAIAAALGKASGATITKGEMTTLREFNPLVFLPDNTGISDLTGLEFATNLDALWISGDNNTITDLTPLRSLTKLKVLWLDRTWVADLSPLARLTKLERLNLARNRITDISPLRGLTKLEWLYLDGNRIEDLSPLRGLIRLDYLLLDYNRIEDVSSLRGLTNLEELDLAYNRITDISPLRGLTNLRRLDLRLNPLSVSSIDDHIPALERSGATVRFYKQFRDGDFDIELVFLGDDFTEKQKRLLQYAVQRWRSIIREDLPDHTFESPLSHTCGGGGSLVINSGERIDDLRIYVGTAELPGGINARGGPFLLGENHLPVAGCVEFQRTIVLTRTAGISILDIMLHEIGHVLGIGTIWHDFIQNPSGDTHFNGPLAIAAFDDAGGTNYPGAKVPVMEDGGHWRADVLWDELMRTQGSGSSLSAITVQALADLGWVVDVTQADPYTIPLSELFGLAKAQVAASAEPAEQWSCGVGEQREPIYVVDPQGNIIRTLHR